jgi:hypothetical protein
MTPEEKTPSIADDPEFVSLRPEVREKVRAAELVIREGMKEFVAAMPAHLSGHLQKVVTEIPARFLRGLLPFFRDQSEMQDYAEVILKHVGRRPGNLRTN